MMLLPRSSPQALEVLRQLEHSKVPRSQGPFLARSSQVWEEVRGVAEIRRQTEEQSTEVLLSQVQQLTPIPPVRELVLPLLASLGPRRL